MDIRHLVTFTTVLQTGTLLAASRVLGYSQSAVTLHIQQLERDLGVRVFERVGKRVALTEAGRAIQERSAQILRGLDQLKREMKALHSGDAGVVRMGVIEPTATNRIPSILAALCARRPGLEIHLDASGTASILKRVLSGELDFGVTTGPTSDMAVEFEPLFQEKLVLAIPRRAALARTRTITGRSLERVPVMLTEQGCAYRRTIEEAFARKGCRIQVAHEIGSSSALLNAARHGLGVGIVPLTAARGRSNGLVLREVSDVDLTLSIGLATRRGGCDGSRATVAVLEHLRRGLAVPGARAAAMSPGIGQRVPAALVVGP